MTGNWKKCIGIKTMWEFSHSEEAYADLEENIYSQDRKWLETVYAEIQAIENGELNQKKYKLELKTASNLSNDALAEAIFEWTMQDRTCDNGGFNAYCCPFRCECHMVSMSLPEEKEEKEDDDDDFEEE